MKKIVCIVGPDESYAGGILEVMNQILNYDFHIDDLKIISIRTASRRNKIKTFFKGLYSFIFFCINNSQKLVHIQLSEGASIIRTLVIINISRIFNVKVILHSHGGMFYEQYRNKNRLTKFIINNTFNKADKILVLTKGWKTIWENIVSKEKIEILPNGTKINNSFVKKYLYENKLNILFMGNISDFKGVYDLIDAINILRKEKKFDLILRIAGGGEIEKCRDYIKKCELNDYIELLGWVEGEEKEKLLLLSDVLVLPSHFESFGIVAIEAMAYRLPVICGDTGFTKEVIIPGKTGIVAKTSNSEDIAKKIEIFYDEKILKSYGERAYKHVTSNFAIDRVMLKLRKVYFELFQK